MKLNKTKPVVFLDLCGVIADIYFTRPLGISKLITNRQIKTDVLFVGDRVHVPTLEMLNAVFNKHDVQIVIVSSWVKSNLEVDSPQLIKLGKFLETDRIIGSLHTGGGGYRGDKVKEFVLKEELNNWLVIDDARHQMYRDQTFFNNRRFIHPHGRYGLGGKELEKIDYLLGGQSIGDDFLEKLFELEDIPK